MTFGVQNGEMQDYWIYPPLQVLVVFGRYPNKIFSTGVCRVPTLE